MSILIKGMHIPGMVDNTGIKMELRKLDGVVTIGVMTGGYSCNEQWHYYEIVEVPEPHGRLIDADELEKIKHWTDDLYETEYVEMEDITNVPTVIEAEEQEHE